MNPEEILDIEAEERGEIVIFSRLSISIATIIFSPFFGAILYCINLYRTDQANRMFGSFISIILCNLLVLLPLVGFRFWYLGLIPQIIISHTTIAMLMIYPMWKRHFYKLQYQDTFPTKMFIVFFLISGFIQYLRYDSRNIFPFYNEIYLSVIFITIALIAKAIIDLIAGKQSIERSKD